MKAHVRYNIRTGPSESATRKSCPVPWYDPIFFCAYAVGHIQASTTTDSRNGTAFVKVFTLQDNYCEKMLRNAAFRNFPRIIDRRLFTRPPLTPRPTGCGMQKSSNGALRLHSSNTSANESGPQRRGGLLIGLGWALLGLVTIDQILQYRQEQEADEHRRMLYAMQKEANVENQPNWDKTLPSLFKCRIAHKEPSLDGTKMLRNIGIGDVVEVLEADIGPNQAYHLCRNPSSDRPGSTGWYPIQYLERID